MPTVAALAAASRVLRDWYPEEAERSLRNAIALWERNYEAADPAKQPARRGGFWGFGDMRSNAALQLWITTGDD